ncbi:MAG: GPP34 family phosphoprotein [Bacteroidales bacterium]|nr:GPP34 family phosphoprotein [Bacteroidales bacterium]
MELNLAETFLLLSIKPEKSGFLIPVEKVNPGIIGAIFIELSEKKIAEIKDKKLIIKKLPSKLKFPFDEIVSRIYNSKKEKRVKTWVRSFSNKARKYRLYLLRDLENKGLVRITEKHFLFIHYKSVSLINKKVREKIINDLREALFKENNINNQSSPILALIQACKIQKVLVKEQGELRNIRIKLKEILKNNSISQDVDQVIKEMQAAVAGAVVVTAVVASSGS